MNQTEGEGIKVDLYLKEIKGNRYLVVKTKDGTEYNINTIGWGTPVSIDIKTNEEIKAEEKAYRDKIHKEVLEIRSKNKEKEEAEAKKPISKIKQWLKVINHPTHH